MLMALMRLSYGKIGFFLVFPLFILISPTALFPLSFDASAETYWIDITIDSQKSIENETVYAEGNITIINGGELSLINSVLIMNPTSNGSDYIDIKAGGSLLIDESKINSNTTFGYNILAEKGSSMSIIRSEIRKCGYHGGDIDSGIIVNNENVEIKNSSFFVEGVGISVLSGSISIYNSTFFPAYTIYNVTTCEEFIYSKFSSVNIDNCLFIGVQNSNSSYTPAAGNHFMPRNPGINVTVKNSTFLNSDSILDGNCYFSNVTWTGDHGTWLVSIIGNPVTLDNCIVNNSIGWGMDLIYCHPNIINSSIHGRDIDIFLEDFGNMPSDFVAAELINSSASNFQFSNSLHYLNISRFLNVEVLRQSDMSGIGNVSLKIFDSSNSQRFQGTTRDDGRLSYIPITWKKITAVGETYYSPHSLVAEKATAKTILNGINMSLNRDLQVILDDVPPSLNITSPPDGLITNQTQILVCGTTEAGARITVDGSTVKNDNGAFNVSFWLEEGNNSISMAAWDDAGNSAVATRNVTCMTTPPMLQITEPPEMAVLNQDPIVVRGKSNGSRLEIDGNVVPIMPSGDFTYSWNVTGEGKKTVTAIAWDIAGNSRVVKRSIVFDTTPPAIEVLSPQNGSWLRTESVEVQVLSPEAAGIMLGGLSAEPDNNDMASFKATLNEGENRISISAWDAVGNENSTVLVLYLDSSIFLDLMEPLGDVLVNHSDVIIRGMTEAGATVTVNGTTAQNKDGDFEQILRLPDGKNRITVSSTDRAGNNIVRTLMISVDTVPPAIEVLSPTEASVNEKDIRLRIRSEAGANVTVNGLGAIFEAGDIFYLDSSLGQGDNLFMIRSVDGAGNIAQKEWSIAYVPPKVVANHNGGSGLEPYLIVAVILILATVIAAVVMKKRGR
jgi:hypothetical protein